MRVDAREITIHNCPCCYEYDDCLNVKTYRCQEKLNAFYKNITNKRTSIKVEDNNTSDEIIKEVLEVAIKTRTNKGKAKILIKNIMDGNMTIQQHYFGNPDIKIDLKNCRLGIVKGE